MFKLRMIGKIVRQAGLGYITAVFFVLFLLACVLLCVVEPGGMGFGDALWISFQTVTTIGFGDVPTSAFGVRVVLACLSVISIFYIAVITGVVVAYCNQIVRSHANDSLMRVVDKLEHLEELSPEELAELSRQVRAKCGARDGGSDA